MWLLGVAVTTFILLHVPPQLTVLIATLSVLGLVSLADEDYRSTAGRIREALSILRIPVETAAEQYMSWNKRSFHRALAGDERLDLWRLAMLGSEFRRVYALLELRDLGLPQLAQTALKIHPFIQNPEHTT